MYSVGNVLPLQVAMAVPLLLIVAVVATGNSKKARLRSIWLGVLIGVGVFTVVGGGRCMELLNPLGY